MDKARVEQLKALLDGVHAADRAIEELGKVKADHVVSLCCMGSNMLEGRIMAPPIVLPAARVIEFMTLLRTALADDLYAAGVADVAHSGGGA